MKRDILEMIDGGQGGGLEYHQFQAGDYGSDPFNLNRLGLLASRFHIYHLHETLTLVWREIPKSW